MILWYEKYCNYTRKATARVTYYRNTLQKVWEYSCRHILKDLFYIIKHDTPSYGLINRETIKHAIIERIFELSYGRNSNGSHNVIILL